MPSKANVEVSELERSLQARFNKDSASGFSSTASKASEAKYVKDLVVADDERGRMPYTKESLVVSENPVRVEWEREVRKFLGKLSRHTSHRISAPMIYEWATNIKIADLLKEDEINPPAEGERSNKGNLNVHLRHINWVLRAYFGKPYKTKIMGREVGRAYTVRQDFRVDRKKPANLTLWPEWDEGTLSP